MVADIVAKKDSNIPSGYTGSLNIIGEKGATNLVNKLYTNLSRANEFITRKNKVYVFYKTRDDSGIATIFSNGTTMMTVFGGLMVLVFIALMIRRSR